MGQFLTTVFWALVCLVIGLATGIWLGLHQTQVPAMQQAMELFKQQAWTRDLVAQKDNGAIEDYNYPTIKWKAKPMSAPPEAISRNGSTLRCAA